MTSLFTKALLASAVLVSSAAGAANARPAAAATNHAAQTEGLRAGQLPDHARQPIMGTSMRRLEDSAPREVLPHAPRSDSWMDWDGNNNNS